ARASCVIARSRFCVGSRSSRSATRRPAGWLRSPASGMARRRDWRRQRWWRSRRLPSTWPRRVACTRGERPLRARFGERPGARAWATYAAIALALLYLHATSLTLIVGVAMVTLALVVRRRDLRAGWLVAHLSIAIGFVPGWLLARATVQIVGARLPWGNVPRLASLPLRGRPARSGPGGGARGAG